MSEIWAKSRERSSGTPVRLYEHIRDVLKIFDQIKCYSGIPKRYLCELIRLAIVCHDFGKTLPAFQIRTLKNGSYTPSYPYYDVPHSLFSVLWIDSEKLQEEISKYIEQGQEDYVRLILCAVAYHHWREDFAELISSYSRKLGDLCRELQNRGYIEPLKENLIQEIKLLDNQSSALISFNNEMAEGLKNGVPFLEYAPPPYQLYWLPKRMEIDDQKLRDWIFISGFLMRSDHFASFCEEEGEEYPPEIQSIPPSIVQENIKTKIRDKVGYIDEKQIWQFQKIDDLKDKNVILIAPTGYGKTEFAFLWSNGEKFFYTLPLRAAVNQIFKRASQIFQDSSSEEKVGLLHSDADVYLLGDAGEAQASLRSYDLARQLAYPVLISTGDQFFPYALRPPGYERIYATFSYSRLVIDEVQAYDPRAAAIIIKFMEDTVRLGGKFLLMTATLPKFVTDEVDRVIGRDNYKILNLYSNEESKLKQLKKHHIKVELVENTVDENRPDFGVPENHFERILDKAREGNRVLVIANTVKQAQDIFSRLRKGIEENPDYRLLKDKIWLLHSRFTQADRSELETKICGDRDKKIVGEFQNPKPDHEKQGKILVATQVVEASLDIDADILFTEIAPLDALVQRMGRILRRYDPRTEPADPNIYVWVFQNGLQSGQHYVYDPDLILLTLRLLEDLSNGQINRDYKDWLSQRRGDQIEAAIREIFNAQSSKLKTKKTISKEFQLVLSEYDKFDLVEKLYDLPDEHSYLTEFRKTKDILDAGYMSDRLSEAQELFRRIYEISIIPSPKKNEFIKQIQHFFSTERHTKGLFTQFKKEVLSQFVVQVPLYAVQERKTQPVEIWVRSLIEIPEEHKKRLIRWCRDIYLADYKYDPSVGIEVKTPYHNIEECML